MMTNPAASRTTRSPFMRWNLDWVGRHPPNYLKARAGNRRRWTINQESWLCRGKGLDRLWAERAAMCRPRPDAPQDRRECSHGWDSPDSDREGGAAAGGA